MLLAPGTYKLGPGNGALLVRTGRTGAAAKAGHDLVLCVTSWEATLEVGEAPADTRLALAADATSLRVREGTGGIQTLGEDDKANIEKTIDDDVLKRQGIVFRSTGVQATAGGSGLTVDGELTLVGKARSVAFDVAVGDDGRLRARAALQQTGWGMKLYSTLFGTLKVADEVEVTIDAALPGG